MARVACAASWCALCSAWARVRVVTLKNLTVEQKDLLRKLGESLGDTGVSPKKKSIFGGK